MANKKIISERHFIASVEAEFRTTEKDGQRIIEGYAAVFDTPADIGGMFTEYVRSGAFTKTIQENDIRALFNHNPDHVLGRNKAGTLTLQTDKKGLFFSVQAPETSFANDLIESISRKDVSQCSFGFKTMKDNWFTEEKSLADGNKIIRDARELLEVKLFDVSPVTYPAYEETSVSARDMFSIEDFDVEHISQIVFKAETGRKLSDEERKILNTTIRSLSGYLAVEPTAPGDHSSHDAEPVIDITLLRSKLELMERQG